MTYILLLRSCKLIGDFVISPLPPVGWSRTQQQGLFAPRALPRITATAGPSATLSSSTDFPVSPVIRFPCSADFSPRRGGLLQLLNVSLSSCRRYRPARASRRISQLATIHVAFTLACGVRPLGLGSRGNLCVHFRYGPMTCSPSHGWLCRSTPCASFPPRMRSRLRGADSYPAGPTPTEHISLLQDMRLGIPLPRKREFEVVIMV